MSELGRRWGGWRGRGWGRGWGWRRGPIVYVAPPVPVCPCPDVYAPVLANDGNAYDNECLARCAGVHVVSRVRNVPAAGMRGLGGPEDVAEVTTAWISRRLDSAGFPPLMSTSSAINEAGNRWAAARGHSAWGAAPISGRDGWWRVTNYTFDALERELTRSPLPAVLLIAGVGGLAWWGFRGKLA